ncbi:MAG: thioredoxin family protein [Sphingobacteriales bacterium]|nr:thioredoxin family protein [Sphingobacteriales bacterium]
MKLLSIFFLSFLLTGNAWLLDFSEAKFIAQKENKHILISFSGSDWCGPCILMHKEILDQSAFINYAKDHLVLVKADFPRLKKNQLSPEQLKKNNDLALKYNPEGDFPLTVLTDAEGKVIHIWSGFPGGTSEEFVKQVADTIQKNALKK